MRIRTIVGLTATAPVSTLHSIAANLGISAGDGGGVIRGTLLPLNLRLSVSRDANRDAALVNLLDSGRFRRFESIIIYCIRREECERIATMLRTYLKDPDKVTHSLAQSREVDRGQSRSDCQLTIVTNK